KSALAFSVASLAPSQGRSWLLLQCEEALGLDAQFLELAFAARVVGGLVLGRGDREHAAARAQQLVGARRDVAVHLGVARFEPRSLGARLFGQREVLPSRFGAVVFL